MGNSAVKRSERRAGALRTVLIGVLMFSAALSLLLGVGVIAMWPRISGQHLPFSLIWPFARPLLAATLELSFLVSLPVALGWLTSHGAARAVGPAPWQTSAASTVLLVALLGSFSFGVSSWLDGDGSSPGQLAAELLQNARASCTESAPPAEVSVPLLGFTWVCEVGRAPRLKGHAPLGKQAKFEAGSVTLADDLKRISLAHFALTFPQPLFQVQVHAEHATLSGLPPWGRSRRMPRALRAGMFLFSAGIGAFGVARSAARRTWLRAWAGALLGTLVSAALWAALTWLERREPRALTYLALPAVAVGSVLLVAQLLSVAERLGVGRGKSGSNTPST